MTTKGIFCIEGLWSNDVTRKSTVLPMLEMLAINGGTKFVHHHSATPAEFEFFLNKWKIYRKRNFPILYLAFHGEKGSLKIGELWYSINDLANLLENSCANSIVILASCKTMNATKYTLDTFLSRTGALALFGYRKTVNWMTAAACELLLLSSLQQAQFSNRGITFEVSRIRIFNAFYSNLGFSMVSRKHVRLENIYRKGTSSVRI